MPIKTKCKSCSRTLSVPSKHAGKKIRCPGCKQGVSVPSPDNVGERPRPPRPTKARSSASGPRPARSARPAAAKPRSKRRRREEEYDPDDIWSTPIQSRGAAIDEDEYEDYGVAPRKRRANRKDGEERERSRGGSKSSKSSGGVDGMMIAAIGCCGISLLLGVIAIALRSSNEDAAHAIAIGGVLFGGAVTAVANWIMLSNAYEDEVGMLYRFVPFYAFFYIFTNLDRNGRPFLANVAGVVCCVVCFFGMAGG